MQNPCKISVEKELQSNLSSSARRPSPKQSAHFHSEFGPWFLQVAAFLPLGRSPKSNALCVC